jgi:LysM repeat protein
MSTLTASRPVTASAVHVPHYRLTRRGRLVVLLAGVLALLAIGVVFAGVSLANGEPAPTETIVVGPGDTLWDIASEVGDGDVRASMRTIEELNSLDSVALAVGQRLVVPAE